MCLREGSGNLPVAPDSSARAERPFRMNETRWLAHPRNAAGALDALYVCGAAESHAPAPGRGEHEFVLHDGPRDERILRIFHFNDLHNALLDPGSGGGAITPLFSRIVNRYRTARAAAGPNEIVLLLS